MKKENGLFKMIVSYGTPPKVMFLFAMFMSIFGTIASLILTFQFKKIVDAMTTNHMITSNVFYLIFWLILNLLSTTISDYLFGIVGFSTVKNLRDKIWDHVLQLPQYFFTENEPSNIASHVVNDTEKIAMLISENIPQALNGAIMVIGSGIMLFWLNWKLTLIVIIMIPILMLIIIPLNSQLKKISNSIQIQTAKFLELLTNLSQGSSIVKSFSLGKRAAINEKKESKKLYNYSKKQTLILSIINPIISIIMMIMMFSIILAGGELVIKNIMTLGSLSAYLLYLIQIFSPVTNIFSLVTEFSQAEGATRILDSYLSINEENLFSGILLKKINNIEIKNLWFKYQKGKDYTLKGVNLNCKEGEKISIIGESGSGKTTLINCILGFYKTNENSILINGRPVSSYTKDSFRKRVAYISQNNIFIPGTLIDNLSEGSSTKKLKDALNMLNLSDRISLKDYFSDYSSYVSGGEAQRLAISRAIAKDFDVLILDEGTASLDKQNTYRVHQLIEKYAKNKIIINITHNKLETTEYNILYQLKNGSLNQIVTSATMTQNKHL